MLAKAKIRQGTVIGMDGKTHGKAWLRSARRSGDLYLLLIPGILFIALFNYIPMYGAVIAFKDYNIFAGANPIDAIFKSEWAGLQHWRRLWIQPEFRQAFGNTLIISLMKIGIGFPIPVILALLLNELRNIVYKRVIQTTLYLPHFMSWAVVGALFLSIMGTGGAVNAIISGFGGQGISFFMSTAWFRWVLLISSIWKESGWNTIVYLAAVTGIASELYEAATADGAGRFRQALHITLPGISPTIMMLLILRLGGLLEAGFDQVLIMYNPTVYSVGDIIGTYVYRIGLGQMNFSLGTAVGLFNSVVNFALVVSSNLLCRRIFGRSIW